MVGVSSQQLSQYVWMKLAKCILSECLGVESEEGSGLEAQLDAVTILDSTRIRSHFFGRIANAKTLV